VIQAGTNEISERRGARFGGNPPSLRFGAARQRREKWPNSFGFSAIPYREVCGFEEV